MWLLPLCPWIVGGSGSNYGVSLSPPLSPLSTAAPPSSSILHLLLLCCHNSLDLCLTAAFLIFPFITVPVNNKQYQSLLHVTKFSRPIVPYLLWMLRESNFSFENVIFLPTVKIQHFLQVDYLLQQTIFMMSRNNSGLFQQTELVYFWVGSQWGFVSGLGWCVRCKIGQLVSVQSFLRSTLRLTGT